MKTACEYIEKHHDQAGVTLFVLPVLVAAFGVAAVCLVLQSVLS